MSDYVVKVALIASIILMGYNISEFITNFKNVSEKIDDFLKMAKENSATSTNLRRSNFFVSSVLLIGYSVLIFFSNVAIWLVTLAVIKLLVTLIVSDKVLAQVLRDNSISIKSYLVSKYDSFFNILLGLVFSLILVL